MQWPFNDHQTVCVFWSIRVLSKTRVFTFIYLWKKKCTQYARIFFTQVFLLMVCRITALLHAIEKRSTSICLIVFESIKTIVWNIQTEFIGLVMNTALSVHMPINSIISSNIQTVCCFPLLWREWKWIYKLSKCLVQSNFVYFPSIYC